MEIKIKRLEEIHIDALETIENECFSEPWSRNALSELLTNDCAVYFVAEYEGEVAGYIGMYVSFEVGAINNVGVLPSFRRLGIGRALIGALIDYSRANGISILTLEVRKSNIAAISLYKDFGFALMGERKNFYKKPVENALIYNLEL